MYTVLVYIFTLFFLYLLLSESLPLLFWKQTNPSPRRVFVIQNGSELWSLSPPQMRPVGMNLSPNGLALQATRSEWMEVGGICLQLVGANGRVPFGAGGSPKSPLHNRERWTELPPGFDQHILARNSDKKWGAETMKQFLLCVWDFFLSRSCSFLRWG